MVTVTEPVPESVTVTFELPSEIAVLEIAPIDESTYALIDCCVASAVLESDDMLSSSKILSTLTPSLNPNDPNTLNPSLILTKVESVD